MKSTRSTKHLQISSLTAILALSSGCMLYRANKAYDEGRYEEAAHAYSRIIQQNPSNVKARMGYRRAAIETADKYLQRAKDLEKKQRYDEAQQEVLRALKFDPQNSLALDWAEALEEKRNELLGSPEEDLRTIRSRVEKESVIKLQTKEPILKQFRVANRKLSEIFEILEKHFGINFLFHSSFQNDQTSITFKSEDMTLERILDTLAIQTDVFYRYIDTKTVMVFKGGQNAAQRAELENQQYKTIYLDNAKPGDINTTLTRLFGQSQRIQITPDNRLNAIIVKGRQADVKLATQMAQMLDKAKAEVMVYIELLEVTESSLETVGLMPVIQPGGDGVYQIGATLDNSGGPNINKGAIRISKSDVRFLFPSVQLDALKTSGEAKMAAKGNMRIASDAAAMFNFGESVYMQQASAGYGTGTTGSASQYLPSYYSGNQYAQQDVGVKVEITPRVHHNGDISMDVKAEVSNLKASGSPERPDKAQRKLNTEVRTQNGETIIFGGLRREDEVKSRKGIWGISDIPIIGKLLGSNGRNTSKTDILLTVRAVIVRKPDLRESDFRAFDPDFTIFLEEMEAQERARKQQEAKDNLERAKAEAEAAARAKEEAEAAAKAEAEAKVKAEAEAKAMAKAEAEAKAKAEAAKQKPTDPEQNIPAAAIQKPAADNPAVPISGEKDDADTEKKSEKPPVPSDLVLFLIPITSQISVGDSHQVNMMVSGGEGVTSGEFVFRIDPKLKVVAIAGAEFVTSEGGSITVDPPADGTIKVKFRKNTARSDSGALLSIKLEGLEKGAAAVMVEGYKCYIADNSILAQVTNAVVEVE